MSSNKAEDSILSQSDKIYTNLEKCDENAIHSHEDLWQPILAKVGSGTYPKQTRKVPVDKIKRKWKEVSNCKFKLAARYDEWK